jgi:hypothetical protein
MTCTFSISSKFQQSQVLFLISLSGQNMQLSLLHWGMLWKHVDTFSSILAKSRFLARRKREEEIKKQTLWLIMAENDVMQFCNLKTRFLVSFIMLTTILIPLWHPYNCVACRNSHNILCLHEFVHYVSIQQW